MKNLRSLSGDNLEQTIVSISTVAFLEAQVSQNRHGVLALMAHEKAHEEFMLTLIKLQRLHRSESLHEKFSQKLLKDLD